MSTIPVYASSFANALLKARVDRLQLDLCFPAVQGYRGILTTTRIQYNDESFNLIRRAHEFTFELPEKRIPLSLQLYRNVDHHYRLCSFTTTGGLFTVNLTKLKGNKDVFALAQVVMISAPRGISASERAERTVQLCAALTRLGLEVEGRRLILGTFDAKNGLFVDTSAQAFLRDFALASLLKGHYMGNKGYSLPGLPLFSPVQVEKSAGAGGRIIPLGVRFQVLEAARGRCVSCGLSPKDGVKIHVDHIKPYSQGGKTEISNLQALCHLCNLGKGNRSEGRFD